MEYFKAEEENGEYQLSLGSEKLEIGSHKELLKLIFEKNKEKKSIEEGKLGEIIDRIFPLPFPWTENLNYQ